MLLNSSFSRSFSALPHQNAAQSNQITATTGAGTENSSTSAEILMKIIEAAAQSASHPISGVSVSASTITNSDANINNGRTARTDWNLGRLGRLALASGNIADAMRSFKTQFELAKQSGYAEDIAEAATDFAYVLVITGDHRRAARTYAIALDAWKTVCPRLAVKSPRVISAFALFLHDYSGYLMLRNNFTIAARAKRRLEMLANRFSAFTVYSALAKRLRERGQQREAKMILDRARPKLVNKAKAAYTSQVLHNIKAYGEPAVFLPPLKFSAE